MLALPPKSKVYSEMESLIWHFKLIYDGVKVPAGSSYSATEGSQRRARLLPGIGRRTGKPYRIKVRPPCFAIFQAYSHMLEGCLVPDAIAILSSLNIIAGELDR